MKRLCFALLLAAFAVAACGQLGSPQTAQQKVFAAGTLYEATTTAALIYINLPRCLTPKMQPCSEQGAVDQIKQADNVAFAALTQAQVVVVDPTKTATVTAAAVTAVQSALTVFGAVMTQYNIGVN